MAEVETCGELSPPPGRFGGCTKSPDHFGERHTAHLPGIGSITWGYLPVPEVEVTYGTWATLGAGGRDVETFVETALGDFADDYDVEKVAEAYVTEINDDLPGGVVLRGDTFYGPWPIPEGAREQVRRSVGSWDIFEIAGRFGPP